MNKILEERKTVGWRKRKCLHLPFLYKNLCIQNFRICIKNIFKLAELPPPLEIKDFGPPSSGGHE